MLLNKKSEDTVVIGKRYAVRNVIRSDEYGEVCKAYDTVMLRTVRMTRLIAEDAPQEVGRAYELYRRREQFLQAYRTLSSLHSSSLPLIYTIQQEGMGAFAVYENVCAPSLGEMLRTEKRVSFETAKERLLPVTAALKLMHDKGVFHGNVSKDSIVMTNTTAVLSDAVGIDADAAQDIRALLSLMFRMMTGKHLQTAQTQETAVQKSSEHDALVQDAKETPLSAPDKIEDIYSHSDNGSHTHDTDTKQNDAESLHSDEMEDIYSHSDIGSGSNGTAQRAETLPSSANQTADDPTFSIYRIGELSLPNDLEFCIRQAFLTKEGLSADGVLTHLYHSRDFAVGRQNEKPAVSVPPDFAALAEKCHTEIRSLITSL